MLPHDDGKPQVTKPSSITRLSKDPRNNHLWNAEFNSRGRGTDTGMVHNSAGVWQNFAQGMESTPRDQSVCIWTYISPQQHAMTPYRHTYFSGNGKKSTGPRL